jgi:ABC-2 type transport system ATP-binding protein
VTGPSLELVGLTKAYGRSLALDSVSLARVGAGAIGYLGPNGAGKTTTLKLLTSLLQPTRGRAFVNGIDVHADPRGALANLGSLVETPKPYGSFTVGDALEMVADFRGLSRETFRDRAGRLTEELDLPDAQRFLYTLSTGLRQRVVLAGAVLADPPVLLLDEPTSGLDPAERVRVRRLIRRLQHDHLLLMSSHLLGEVAETCDEVAFLQKGRILRRAKTSELATGGGRGAVEVEFVREVDAERLRAAVAPLARPERIDELRWGLEVRGDRPMMADLLDRLRTVAPVAEFRRAGSNLEDAYLDLMEGGRGAPPREATSSDGPRGPPSEWS